MQAVIAGHLLLDRVVLESPTAFYRQLHDAAPVWRVGSSDVYVAASYDAVTQACRRVEDFSSNLRYFLYRDEQGLPARHLHHLAEDPAAQFLATADPPRHGEHKKIISPEFSPKRIAALAPQLADMTRARLAVGLSAGRMEFMSELANLIPIDVVSELIAFKQRNTEALFSAAIVQTDMLAAAISKAELESRLAVSSETVAWVFQQLQEALRSPGDGILGQLAMAINGGEIDVRVAMAILATLFAAGGESTSSLIGNAVFMLAEDLELQDRLRNDPTIIPLLVEEVLRLESPFRYHMRLVTRDCTLDGVEIAEGSTLLLLWGAANRDPAQFERPDEVDLGRPRRHVGFGSGIHVCLGNTLARLEARIVLETLLSETASFELAGLAEWVPSLAVRRLDKLPLTIQARR